MQSPLQSIVSRFAGRRVLLVGDFMLDRYVFGDVGRISPEAPVPVVHVTERQDRVGGAGSVALNIVALGAEVQCFGLVGRDLFGERVLDSLRGAGAHVDGMVRTEDRPTITKTRIVGLAEHRHRQQLMRIDDEIAEPLLEPDAGALCAAIERALAKADVVCLEDYAKGVLTPAICERLIGAARKRSVPVLIDPARHPAWEKYRGATSMTPNLNELEIGVGRALQRSEIEAAAADVVERLALESLVVTLGRDGALLVRRDGSSQHLPTTPRAVYDNTGAGDAVLAMMAVALAAGASDEQAVQLANIAGGIEVQKFGCVPISRDEVLAELEHGSRRGRGKIRTVEELRPELDARRQRGESIVMTNGCFDILHPGHIEFLERAKSFGSVLVVAINTDESVRAQAKGPQRPIRREADRARMLAALEFVDFVVSFGEATPERIVRDVTPDVLVKGTDWAVKGVVGREFVEGRGGRVELIDLVDGFSTTSELQRVLAAAEAERAVARK
ncbi:MAG: bifunctional heptose 7-phosphate kinase/heptose 1-phosphate adenyltransferase [Phycisphaerae bacterium]|nr:bifunctional heptose 7-phosphate kinase/heptose 1-phosphate adenyltransferase [Phycisphaerae bacterium]